MVFRLVLASLRLQLLTVVDISSDHSRRIARVALACNNTFQKLACIAEDATEEDSEKEINHAEAASAIAEFAPGGIDGSDVAVRDLESCGWSRPEEDDDSGPSRETRGAAIRAPSALVSEGGGAESSMSGSRSLVASQAQSVSSLTGTYRGYDVFVPQAGALALALARRQPTEKTRAAE